MLRRKFFQSSFFSIFLLIAASFQFFNFSATSCIAFLTKMVPSSPIRYTRVFSHAELDLPTEWLSIIVVFEIQALVVTQIMRILNFFALHSGSPWCSQSSIIFSELNFYQEKPVELFVQGVLGDLSFIRIEFSVSLKRITPITVPLTFL